MHFLKGIMDSHLHGVEWRLNDTIAMLLRRWPVLVGSMAVMLALAAVWLVVTPPEYTATSLLQINTRQEKVMAQNIQDVVSDLNASDAAIRTELDVLQSRKLARRVIEKMNLLETSDLAGRGSLLGAANDVLGMFMQREHGTDGTASDYEYRMTAAVSAFLKRLDVRVLPRSYSIDVRFVSRSPQTAQNVVNTLASEYLTSQLEDRLDAARRATEWMGDRAKNLQKQVQASERAVNQFRENHNLTTAKGVTLNEQQLSELNSQLILARAQLAEAQAKANSSAAVKAGRLETTTEVLNNPLIQNLRQQETEVRREMSDLAARYGTKHPRMVTIRNELADVQRKIAEESAKIRGSLQNELEVANARVRTFENQLESLQNQTRLQGDDAVQLAELERQAQAERSLYESFLNRSKEIAQMDFAQSDARVIYAAEVPLAPSHPRVPLTLALAAMAGMGIGLALVVLLEALDGGFRASKHIEETTKLPVLGMLAELPTNDSALGARYVLDKPTSAFTEGVRAIRAGLAFANPDTRTQVILITSSSPQEGKSMLAASLAQVAGMSGARVLLIDADMRRPTQAKQFGLTPKAGLAEVLAGQANLKDILTLVPSSTLTVIPALSNAQFAQELLSSGRMKDLMTELRKHYDTIIIDSPPVMAVADALVLSGVADAVLFAVRWGVTPRPLALNAIQQAQTTPRGVTGIVLTRVDMDRQKAYGYGDYGYYYRKYKDYYTE